MRQSPTPARRYRTAIALALATLLSTSLAAAPSGEAVASSTDCFDTTPSTTPPAEASVPSQVGGAYQLGSKAELLWASWVMSASNTVTTTDAASHQYKRWPDAIALDFEQTASIDLGGCLFSPLGYNGGNYSGTYDGGSFSVSNVKVVATSAGAGFFGWTNGASISDISLVSVDVQETGAYGAGGLIGSATDTSVSRVAVSGDVTGTRYVGGLIGSIDTDGGTSSVSNSSSTASVSASENEESQVGGLLGYMSDVTLSGSSASGSVTSSGSWVGGLVGNSFGSTTTRSFATGAVNGVGEVGGLVGRSARSDVSYSFASGAVTGTNDVGGLIGETDPDDDDNVGSVENSYAVGAVTGTSASVGGLIGDPGSSAPAGASVENSFSTGAVSGPDAAVGGLIGPTVAPTVTASFWDETTSGLSTSNGGTSKTTTQMTSLATYTSASWAIVAATALEEPSGPTTEIWGISESLNCGYPFLWWQTEPALTCDSSSDSSQPSGSSDSDPEERADDAGIHLEFQAVEGDSVAGAPVVIGGEGLAGSTGYSLIVRSTPQVVESGTTSGLGNFSKRVTMPALPAGSHTLTLTATAPDGSTLSLVQPFTVAPDGTITSLEAVSPSAAAALAATGVRSGLVIGGMLLAITLIVLGASVMYTSRSFSSVR